MQFTLIRVEKLFPTGAYANEKLIAEVSLNAGENPLDAFDAARKLIDEDFAKHNPHLITPDVTPYSKIGENKVQSPLQKINIVEESLEDQIESVTSLAVLKAVYEKIVKGKPEQKIYDKKFKELSK